MILVFLLFAVALPAAAQTSTTSQPVMVEDVFKNVQVLKGIPVNEFMDTMGFFSAALGLNCTGCHVAESLQDWSKFAEDVPRKRTARNMIRMVDTINKTQFSGARMLTCWSCHRGAQVPELVPSLAAQYTIAPEDPNALEIVPDGPQEPTPDQILDQYIQALGGRQRLMSLTSFAAKGTIEGYDTYHAKVPVEIYAKVPNQRAMIWHTQNGNSSIVFDGRGGWIAQVNNPVRLLPMMPGAEMDGGKTRFKLYFETETGLLARQVRYSNTPIGVVPTQVDYSDYREVAGIKLPFKIVITWTDGQSIIQLNDVQPNVTIPAETFAKPAPPSVK